MIEIQPQCCDASGYLGLGYQCSITFSKCLSANLRPIGIKFFYAFFFKTGTELYYLNYLNIILLLLSSFFSSKFILKEFNSINSFFSFCVVFPISLIVHYIFLKPVIFTTLADFPAAIFFLIGSFIMLIYKKNFLIFFAAIVIGLTPSLRVFYLYPILFSIILFSIISMSIFFFRSGGKKSIKIL